MPISITNDPAMNQGVRLGAGAMFPGHARGREHMYWEFARGAAKAGTTVPVHCAELGGDCHREDVSPASGSLPRPESEGEHAGAIRPEIFDFLFHS